MNVSYIVLVVAGVGMFLTEVVVRRRRRERVDVREMGVSVRVGLIAYASGALPQTALMALAFWASRHFISWQLPLWNPLTWLGYIVLDDFTGYWIHRASHRYRMLWSAHQVHHSTTDFNMANAARLSPVEALYQPLADIWAPLLGFPVAIYAPLTVFSLLLAEFQHTTVIGKLGWVDRWFNTPSNHRAHHGRNPVYIDKNFGGWTMIWDHLFGTYAPETEAVVFGVTDPLDTSTVTHTALGGYPLLVHDIRADPTPTGIARVALSRPGQARHRGGRLCLSTADAGNRVLQPKETLCPQSTHCTTTRSATSPPRTPPSSLSAAPAGSQKGSSMSWPESSRSSSRRLPLAGRGRRRRRSRKQAQPAP